MSKNKYTRKSLPGINMKNIKLFPNGERTAETKIKNLKSIGIQLKTKQEMINFTISLMQMIKAGFTEVNITGWLKTGQITFTSQPIKKQKTDRAA
jgi:hypothetical protein